MKSHFALYAAAAFALLAASNTGARADLMWEHTGTVSSSKYPKPVAQIKLYNTWTPSRYRFLLKYAIAPDVQNEVRERVRDSVGGPGPIPFPMLQLAPNNAKKSTAPAFSGQFGLVQRLDDDRIVFYESQSKSIVDEKRTALFERLRFNPWKKLDPKLAAENPPELTAQQRERLVDEIAALTKPARDRMVKTYFRTLPEARSFSDIKGTGYRLTQLVNGGGRTNQSWTRFEAEWWMAAPQEGDEAATEFRAQTLAQRQQRGGWTNSMWLNELFALSRIPTDPTLRRAYLAMQLPKDAPVGSLGGTLLSYRLRIVPPALERAQVGDITFDIKLTKRDTEALAETVFQAPEAYKKQDVQPILKQIDPVLDGEAWMSVFNMF